MATNVLQAGGRDERVIELSEQVPLIEPRTRVFGPIAMHLINRALAVWLAFCAIGAVPSLLSVTGLAPVSAAWQAFGWGLWLPGAGFVAAGDWWILLFPLALLLVFVAFWVWVLSGAVILPPLAWLATAIGAYFAIGETVYPYTWVIVPAAAAFVLIIHFARLRWNYVTSSRRGAKRAAELPRMLAELDAATVPPPPPQSRELTPDDIAASRYLFNLALQPIGQFEGFTRIDNFQLAALRYQLNYMSYGLTMLQCKYLPNFHGYLNRAQHYAIESLTTPDVCAYWKYEVAWGLFRWNPDPINTRDNVMLDGLSLSPLTTYAANTGDLRYQTKGALRFRPCRWPNREFLHDTHSFVDSILWNWRHGCYFLYPCEPRWCFPICNSYALAGLIAYDRVNGTSHVANVYDTFMKAFESEFVTPDGGVQPELSTLIGTSPFWGVQQMQFDNLISMAQVVNAIHPGYAKRWYAICRSEYLELGPDGLSIKGRPWDQCFDFGNYRLNPGGALSGIALAAREHGDQIMAEAALSKADELLTRVSEPGVLAYEGTSNVSNINLAVSRWARHDDWHDVNNIGPPKDALSGPILTDCVYPDVLVARAMSDGQSLDLVLYNGRQPGSQSLKIERLKPGLSYDVRGATPQRLVAPADGVVVLNTQLNGRTEVRIIPSLADQVG